MDSCPLPVRSDAAESTWIARARRRFVPQGDRKRDNQLELQVRGLLTDDLPIEPELSRWMAVWEAPGL